MNLLDTFNKLSLEDLIEYVNSKQEENHVLDFKTVSNPRLTSGDDKKNLAKSLSGFANSGGGLIVWGVDARKDSTGIDCASGLNEIEEVRVFLNRLNELTGMAVSPIVDNLQHRIIHEDCGKGYVVSYIPESSSAPHMAKLGGDRYYKRSGDRFYRLEHYDLEDMFGRRPRPHLECATRIQGKGMDVEVIIAIVNSGKGSARPPFIAFDCTPPFHRNEYGLDGNRNEGMKRLPYIGTQLKYRYGEGANIVIHPGITYDVASVYLGVIPRSENKPTSDLTINYILAAEGFPLKKGSKTITLNELGFS